VIELDGYPELVDPLLIAAFEGWNDAGDAATSAVEHLEEVWSATLLTEMDPEDYYDYQVNRPTVSMGEDGRRLVTWPTTRVSFARLPDVGRDLVLIRGIDPNMRWKQYTHEILGVCHELGVEMVVTLGALLADSPHTRPVPVTGTSSDDAVVRTLHLEPSRYEGPTGIVGVVQDACTRAGVPALSIWAAVPHYVAQPPCPKATLALLSRLEDVLDLPVPLADLAEEADEWEKRVRAAAEQDAELGEYVRELEERVGDEGIKPLTGDEIASEFEKYLRRRGGSAGPTAGSW
jgi:proteasome assembly chaperone (PAC2) family protein